MLEDTEEIFIGTDSDYKSIVKKIMDTCIGDYPILLFQPPENVIQNRSAMVLAAAKQQVLLQSLIDAAMEQLKAEGLDEDEEWKTLLTNAIRLSVVPLPPIWIALAERAHPEYKDPKYKPGTDFSGIRKSMMSTIHRHQSTVKESRCEFHEMQSNRHCAKLCCHKACIDLFADLLPRYGIAPKQSKHQLIPRAQMEQKIANAAETVVRAKM